MAVLLGAVGGLFLLSFDYARAMNTYLVLVHATREAARVAGYEGTTTTQVQNAAITAAGDFVSLNSANITCDAVTFNTATGTYVVAGTCASPRVVDSAYRITITKTFQPIMPFVQFTAGSSGNYAPGGITISHQVVGIVMDEP
jgi:Flp pilus assembly protein TadG